MSFHYGREKRKFDQEWARLEAEYAAAGMDTTAIMEMKLFDWKWFCSQRVYLDRTQPFPSEQYQEEDKRSNLFRKFNSLSTHLDTENVEQNRHTWIAHIENVGLSQRLRILAPKDIELLTLLIVDGYKQAEVARLLNCSRSAISQRMKKIKKFLKEP